MLDNDVRPRATQKIRATFERILKEEGVALPEVPEPGTMADAIDLALETYTKSKAVTLVG